ncbi:helix-turn-helix domain-containing protein [Streptomyces spongiae]|uniref:Helix-turn-helix domain-containing protein n=1 Tax=Streptomyces spongiae TaxID=565072 RepID=A0A5N8X9V6_9ACTN|nr:helix-turn-helix domain-containing protein [Streptomyces spongiae]MPY56280.1 helix-turn-helix domain-containing protein [Streptomyces spongiae]
MTNQTSNARVIPLRPAATPVPTDVPAAAPRQQRPALAPQARPVRESPEPAPAKEPLWRDLVGDVLRRERLAQERTLKDVAEAARISMPYLSELERGRKEASSEVLAAAAHALGLGLSDLLSLAHGELTRRTRTTRATTARMTAATTTTSPYNGLCLVA